MKNTLDRYIAPLARRLRLSVGLSVLNLVNDAAGVQTVQVKLLNGELLDNLRRLQNYGHTSHPLPGAQGIGVAVGGNRGNTVLVAIDDGRYRKRDLEPGETALYSDEGDYVLLKRGRIVEVVAGTRLKVIAPEVEVVASSKVMLTTPTTEISGNVTIGGSVAIAGDTTVMGAFASATSVADPQGTMAEIRMVYNSHTHVGGAITGAPQQGMS